MLSSRDTRRRVGVLAQECSWGEDELAGVVIEDTLGSEFVAGFEVADPATGLVGNYFVVDVFTIGSVMVTCP